MKDYMPEGCIVCGELKERCSCAPKYVAMPSFRVAMLHKLGIIIKAYGNKTRAAKRVGVHYKSFCRWLRVDRVHGIGLKGMDKIDAAYLVAVEKLNLKARKRAESF